MDGVRDGVLPFPLGADVPSRRWVLWFGHVGYIDKSLMCQWSCRGRFPLLSGCLRRLWMNSTHFLRDAGLWTISFTSSSYMAATGVLTKPLVPCSPLFGGSAYGCFWKNLTQCLREGCAQAVRTWKSGHYVYAISLTELFFCAMPGSTVDTCTLSALGGFWMNVLLLRAGLTRILWSPGRFASWRSVHSRCFDCLECSSLLHLDSAHYFHEPLVPGRYFDRCSGIAGREEFLGLCQSQAGRGQCTVHWPSRFVLSGRLHRSVPLIYTPHFVNMCQNQPTRWWSRIAGRV